MFFVRADMSKVLVESPREGRGRARAHEGQRRRVRQRADRDGESAPQRFGMQRCCRRPKTEPLLRVVPTQN
jgi:hypothetical protein